MAITNLTHAIKIQPSNADIYMKRARMYETRGQVGTPHVFTSFWVFWRSVTSLMYLKPSLHEGDVVFKIIGLSTNQPTAMSLTEYL